MDPITLWLIIVVLLFSAFFSGMEIAFVTSNKLKIELERKQDSFTGRIIALFTRSDSRFISTMLVGNNIALVLYGMLTARVLDPLLISWLPEGFENNALLLFLQTLISSIFILIFGEFLPKILFQINPNSTLRFFSLPTLIIYLFLFPLSSFTMMLTKFIFKVLFRMDFSEEQKVFSNFDMDNLLREYTESSDNEQFQGMEVEMFKNAMDFPQTKLRECMIPRTEIISLEENEAVSVLKQEFTRTGLSKILIYRESIDNMIGYVHVFNVFKDPESIKSVISPILIVPETMHADNLLKKLIQQHRSVALVVDEFGGTSGLITLEDVMEEIFGEIDDEYDVDNRVEKVLSEDEYLFSARLEIDYLNKTYNLELPESEAYETLGGLITDYHESIPELNEEIRIGDYLFTIVQVSKTTVLQVHLKVVSNE